MLVKKIYYKIHKIILLTFYKVIYRKKLIVKNVNFRNRFTLNIEKTGKVIISDGCFFNNDCSINSMKLVSIGKNSIFGENVKIYDHNHNFYQGSLIKNQKFTCEDVIIGNNVWVGSNVTILAGTKIGDNSVISAGITVKGIIPPNTILKRNDMAYLESIKQEVLWETI